LGKPETADVTEGSISRSQKGVCGSTTRITRQKVNPVSSQNMAISPLYPRKSLL
jgi:hypothetical protein